MGYDSNPSNPSGKHLTLQTHTHTRKNSYLTTYFPGERLFNSNNTASNHLQCLYLLPPLSIEKSQDYEKTKSCMHTVSHTHGHTCLHLIPISFWDQRKIYISSGGAEVFARTLSLFVIRPNPCGSPNHAVCMCPCVCRLRP